MKFTAEGRVKAPVQTVYTIIRDELPRLAPFMDNVETIAELERTPKGDGKVYVLNRWHAEPGQVPAAARKAIKPEMLQWLDHANWDDAGQHVDWRIEAAAFKGLYECTGRNRVVADGDGAKILISADLTIDPSKVPGVPTFLAKKLVPAIESYLVERIKPNLSSLATGVAGFLASKDA
jgi:hypothetical protein